MCVAPPCDICDHPTNFSRQASSRIVYDDNVCLSEWPHIARGPTIEMAYFEPMGVVLVHVTDESLEMLCRVAVWVAVRDEIDYFRGLHIRAHCVL